MLNDKRENTHTRRIEIAQQTILGLKTPPQEGYGLKPCWTHHKGLHKVLNQDHVFGNRQNGGHARTEHLLDGKPREKSSCLQGLGLSAGFSNIVIANDI